MSVWLRVALSFLLAALMAGEAEAGKRIALVIGNGAYTAVSPLTNPKNDADLMATTLQAAGFEVTKITDADQRAMKQAMLDFGRKLHGGVEASLFYYSGHGVQAKGENYLIPVDASIKDEGELDLQAIDVNAFLQVMDNADSKVNIIILDACRNNPFASSMRSASRGLAMVDAPRGTYIAYSTSPGDVAEDGDGKNSPYTAALAKAIATPGLKLEDAFKEARRLVLAATGDKQLPWETTSITGDFYFRPQPTRPPAPASPPPASQPQDAGPAAPRPQPPEVGSGGAAPTSAAGSFEVKQNRWGMDYKNFVLTTADPRLCQQACQGDGLCRAWTYVVPGHQGAGARCWLKKGVPPARSDGCCVSGVKPGAAGAPARPVADAPPPDQLAWQKIAASSDPADFTRFLQAFPQSKLDDGARARLASLAGGRQGLLAGPPPGGNGLPQAGDGNPQNGVFVLLGRAPTREIALRNYRATQERFRDILGDRPTNLAAENERGRIVYRNRIGPFPDGRQAAAFCERFKAAGGLCFVPENRVGGDASQPVAENRTMAPPIGAMGTLQVRQSQMFDLERGAVTQAGADVWFEAVGADQLFLVPQNGAELAPGDRSNRDFGGCATQTYSSNPISLRDLPPGSFVCIKTRDARIGEFLIDGLSGGQPRALALHYTVWK